jgi:GWxTD domain-containing protein
MAIAACAVVAVAGCRGPAPRGPAVLSPGLDAAAIAAGQIEVYRRAGFLAPSGTMPFVGAARVIAGPTPDSALVLVAFSLSNRALTFTRDGDVFTAAYVVTVDLIAEGRTVQRHSSREAVRVAAFRETARPEETVLFQTTLAAPPGGYDLRVRVDDAMGDRAGVAEMRLTIPWLGTGNVSSPIPVLSAERRSARSAPLRVMANPRATAVVGRDTLLQVYLEAYGPDRPPGLMARVVTERGTVLYRDSIVMRRGIDVHGALMRLPVARIGLGTLMLEISERDSDAAPLARLPIVVSLGEELPISTFEDMLEYLRYFTSEDRLQQLRDADPTERGAAWATFFAETDSIRGTDVNEPLHDYLRRVQWANTQYREDGIAGWRTDRGMVYTALGEPDAIAEPTSGDASMRGRRMVWTRITAPKWSSWTRRGSAVGGSPPMRKRSSNRFYGA